MKRLPGTLLTILWSTTLISGHAQNAFSQTHLEPTSIGYATVKDALAALKAKSGVTFRNQDGWTVAEDKEKIVTWMFVPPDHPAYPSVIKRSLINNVDGTYFQTDVKC